MTAATNGKPTAQAATPAPAPAQTAAIQAPVAQPVPLPEPRPKVEAVSTKPVQRHLRRYRYRR